MNKKNNSRFETKAVHSGHVPQDGTNSVTTPIYPSSTYRVEYPGDESGYVYSRWSNPTRLGLENSLAELENGSHAYAFSSGLAALDAVIRLFKPGDHVVAVDDLYGGTKRQFNFITNNSGIEFSYVDNRNIDEFEKAIKKNTKCFWIETPTNPLLCTIDIAKVAEIAHKHNILVGIDNTFASPYIQKPLDCGADIVLHSASKYLGGHCDLIAGVLVVNNEELAEKIRFIQYGIGAMLGPFESWLALRGIKTLPLRMEKHSFNASKIVEFLKTEEKVDKVYFPGVDGEPLPNNMILPGGIVTFSINADFETVKKFVMSTKLFILAESLGGVESLINHPASMTHASIPKEDREKRGINDGLVRLSVGIEHIDDLIADLENAFKNI